MIPAMRQLQLSMSCSCFVPVQNPDGTFHCQTWFLNAIEYCLFLDGTPALTSSTKEMQHEPNAFGLRFWFFVSSLYNDKDKCLLYLLR